MTPFTEVLEHFARLLPDAGGVCINAESELEAVGMAWGALVHRRARRDRARPARASRSCRSRSRRSRSPSSRSSIFNMARGQQDYYQATRGGGHGDYRHIVLAPQDVREGVELVQLAFHLADKWRNPVLIYGDYLLAHTQEALTIEPMAFPELPPKDWAVDGIASGTGAARSGHAARRRASTASPRSARRARRSTSRRRSPLMEREVRVETGYLDDAETVIVAFGSPAKFVKYAIKQLRADGHRIGFVRPITLWPFPYDTVADACARAERRRVGSFELSAGQMIDDVRIGVAGRVPVEFIGGVSTDHSGFGVGRLLDVEVIARADPRPARTAASSRRSPATSSSATSCNPTRRRHAMTDTDHDRSSPVHSTRRPRPTRRARWSSRPSPTSCSRRSTTCARGAASRSRCGSSSRRSRSSIRSQHAIGVAGIGCYTSFSGTMDVDLVQALHGRAPSVATGVKRMLPDALVFTLQGDGDMVNEGLQEVIHTAARGENVTCILLNNGVFGETGGHMTRRA